MIHHYQPKSLDTITKTFVAYYKKYAVIPVGILRGGGSRIRGKNKTRVNGSIICDIQLIYLFTRVQPLIMETSDSTTEWSFAPVLRISIFVGTIFIL